MARGFGYIGPGIGIWGSIQAFPAPLTPQFHPHTSPNDPHYHKSRFVTVLKFSIIFVIDAVVYVMCSLRPGLFTGHPAHPKLPEGLGGTVLNGRRWSGSS